MELTGGFAAQAGEARRYGGAEHRVMDVSTVESFAARPWIEHGVTGVFESCLTETAGQVASYIPELATVDPGRFGLAIASVDGTLFSRGDAEHEFTIQSVSKAFSYCLALELLGRGEVFRHVGVEPSGDAFNAIVFDPRTAHLLSEGGGGYSNWGVVDAGTAPG